MCGKCVNTDTTVRDYAAQLWAMLAVTGSSSDCALPWPDEEPPLTFAVRHRQRDLALRLLSAGC